MVENIRRRRSVRTFQDRELEKKHQRRIFELIEYYNRRKGPSGYSVRFVFAPARKDSGSGQRIGTYGIIKRPQAFVGASVLNKPEGLYDCGYLFEKIILWLTDMGIGTCWLGGTFDRKGFQNFAGTGQGEIIPAVTPLGYPASKKTLRDKTVSRLAKSKKRKPFTQLFYRGSFDFPLEKESAGEWKLPLEMVQLGPSASNRQPWRVVLDRSGASCHLYMKKDSGYPGNKLGFEIQRIDMGVAMAHLEEAFASLDSRGKWFKHLDPGLELPDDTFEYIATYVKS